jgi:hypothetical protein
VSRFHFDCVELLLVAVVLFPPRILENDNERQRKFE